MRGKGIMQAFRQEIINNVMRPKLIEIARKYDPGSLTEYADLFNQTYGTGLTPQAIGGFLRDAGLQWRKARGRVDLPATVEV